MSNTADAIPKTACYTDNMKECTESLVGHTDLQGFSYEMGSPTSRMT